MKYKTIRGFRDILPEESIIWQKFESISRDLFKIYRYNEIRTPIVEETGLFVKSVGEETDIVTKEMFSFKDRGEREISLRPEGTAPIIRAYLENNIYKIDPCQKLYYIGPMFRAERPQAGRTRQFYQIGLEAIGIDSPAIDAEVIAILIRLLDKCGISNYELKLNNLGCSEDKVKLSRTLKELFSKKGTIKLLCEDCQRRLTTNPLRVLDCKNENCKNVIKNSIKEVKTLCPSCEKYFNKVLDFLKVLKIQYSIDPYIVRGLDYYTRTVFEVTQKDLGSQDAIGAGGRYDNLISDMGGPKVGACGFALGLDRMILACKRGIRGDEKEKNDIAVFIVSLGEEAFTKAFSLLDELRGNSIPSDISYEDKSLKSQMRMADKIGAKLVLIIGENELSKNEVVLRNMTTKEQLNIPFNDLMKTIKSKLTIG